MYSGPVCHDSFPLFLAAPFLVLFWKRAKCYLLIKLTLFSNHLRKATLSGRELFLLKAGFRKVANSGSGSDPNPQEFPNPDGVACEVWVMYLLKYGSVKLIVVYF